MSAQKHEYAKNTERRCCEHCTYWSQTCAQSIGCGPMEALCECLHSPKSGKMTTGMDECELWESSTI